MIRSLLTIIFILTCMLSFAQDSGMYLVHKCEDFVVDGKGTNTQWNNASWQKLIMMQKDGNPYSSKSKMLYSEKGVYVLFQGEDKAITTKDYKDFQNIYDGDVFEVFFHPDTSILKYFEYEVNHMDKELILILDRTAKRNTAWIPWQMEYDEHRQIKKAVSLVGGVAKVGGKITSWSAEVFIPYTVLTLLPSMPPKSGTKWNALFGRIDYDTGKQIEYSTCPEAFGFHQLDKFKTIQFE